MSEQPQGPGWWLASDGRYYPPQSIPGPGTTFQAAPPGTSLAPATRLGTHAAIWRRWWFWLACVVLGVAAAAGFVALSDVGMSLTPVRTVDFTSQPDVASRTLDDVSVEVKSGALVVTPDYAGPMYFMLEDVGSVSNVGFAATMRADSGNATAAAPSHTGVLLVNSDGQGYAVTCGTDGNGRLWSVEVQSTNVISTVTDAGCAEVNELGIEVHPTLGRSGDMVRVTVPSGNGPLVMPGTIRGPFTVVGFVSLSEDEAAIPPSAVISKYTILLPD